MAEMFNDEELKLMKKIFGHHHHDHDISDAESAASFALYKKTSDIIKARGKDTTKKLKKDTKKIK